MNLRTSFDVFMLTFLTYWKSQKEDGRDYTFEAFYGIFITDKHRLLEQGKLGGKHQAHLLKVKSKMNYKNRLRFVTST
jgi:hypothetical protein